MNSPAAPPAVFPARVPEAAGDWGFDAGCESIGGDCSGGAGGGAAGRVVCEGVAGVTFLDEAEEVLFLLLEAGVDELAVAWANQDRIFVRADWTMGGCCAGGCNECERLESAFEPHCGLRDLFDHHGHSQWTEKVAVKKSWPSSGQSVGGGWGSGKAFEDNVKAYAWAGRPQPPSGNHVRMIVGAGYTSSERSPESPVSECPDNG